MTWEQHPRLQQQSEERIDTLAKFQYEHGLSREEMAAYFQLLARAKTEGFSTIEEYEQHLAEEKTKISAKTEFTHWDQIAKLLRGSRYPKIIKLGGGKLD